MIEAPLYRGTEVYGNAQTEDRRGLIGSGGTEPYRVPAEYPQSELVQCSGDMSGQIREEEEERTDSTP